MTTKVLNFILLSIFFFSTSTSSSPSTTLDTNTLPGNNHLTCKHVFEFFHHFSSDFSTLNCVMQKLNIQTSEDLKKCRNFRSLPLSDSIMGRRYKAAFDAIFITNRLCQHNFDKNYAEYFDSMRRFYRGHIKKAKLSCYLKKLKHINSEASLSVELFGRNCKSTYEEIDKFLLDIRTQMVEDLHEEKLFHCIGNDLIEEKIKDRLQFKIMGNYEYTEEELVQLKNKHLGKFRRFEERRAECFLKYFYYHQN